MKKLHDLLVLKITQKDEKEGVPLTQIVGRAGIKWTTEYPVDKGWIDILVPKQGTAIEQPYIIEVETGYDLYCGEIIQKFRRFKKATTKPARTIHIGWGNEEGIPVREKVEPKLVVVIPKDFAEFIPTFKNEEISVFLWEGNLEWKCKKCDKITLGNTPWKPSKCDDKSCKSSEKSLRLVGLRDFKLKEAYRVP